MRKRYKLKQPLIRKVETRGEDGKLRIADRVVAEAGQPVAITRTQFDAYKAQSLIDGPVDAGDAFEAPAKPKAKAG